MAEATLLASEHIRQRLQLMSATDRRCPSFPPVVDERIDGLLKHTFFIANYDCWSSQINQAAETVIAIDHAPVEIVKIAGGKSAAV